jgi:hypothetical protein
MEKKKIKLALKYYYFFSSSIKNIININDIKKIICVLYNNY